MTEEQNNTKELFYSLAEVYELSIPVEIEFDDMRELRPEKKNDHLFLRVYSSKIENDYSKKVEAHTEKSINRIFNNLDLIPNELSRFNQIVKANLLLKEISDLPESDKKSYKNDIQKNLNEAVYLMYIGVDEAIRAIHNEKIEQINDLLS